MAALAKTGTPSLCSLIPPAGHQISGLFPGEAIAAGDACRIGSDGKVYKSSGAAADANANVFGFAAQAHTLNEFHAVTLYFDERMNYSDDVTPGAVYYLSGTTAGGLDTGTSTGGTVPIAYGLPGGRIQCLQAILR
jgi:hypothetical protein